MSSADMEKGSSSKQDEVIRDLMSKENPVGGIPGNTMFRVVVQLALRGTIMILLLACIIWVPATEPYFGRFKPYMALAMCIYVFTITPILGSTIDNASAGIAGTFAAVLNTWVLRGFFAEGVEPNGSTTVLVVGWLNFILFDLFFLMANVRMATRMFALANHTGFMLMFLNPADQTPFSKNFTINPNGVAVSSFLGVALGSLLGILTMFVPFPFGSAFNTMKASAHKASADTAKLFLGAVTYFSGSAASVQIEFQLAACRNLRNQLNGLGGPIGAAWSEGFDLGSRGVVRCLMAEQAKMLDSVFDILHALHIALATEDFGESHKRCMNAIGGASQNLAEKVGVLLMYVTHAAGDGSISGGEAAELQSLVRDVEQAKKNLAMKFNDYRKTQAKQISPEILSESFFVFALSAYGRKVCEYAAVLAGSPPQPAGLGATLSAGFMATFQIGGKYYARFVLRYMLALFCCMIFAVTMDNYGGACAVMAVFLLNTRVGPDMMATINTLLAVVIAVVVGGVVYSYSCDSGYGDFVLLIISFFYFWITMIVAFGGSSFALIGIFMAALYPFTTVKECPSFDVSDQAAAAGLWIAIRGTLIAMLIVSFFEICSIPGEQAKLACESLDDAIKHISAAFDDLWSERDPHGSVSTVSGSLGDAAMFNAGAKLEPRFWKCKWKAEFVAELIDAVTKLRLDVLTIRHAMEGSDGDCDEVVKTLKKVSAFKKMEDDISRTLEDAREIAIDLVKHEHGTFSGMNKLDSVEGLDDLDGYDAALNSLNLHVKLSPTPPDSMEDDLTCQLCIVCTMLDYSVKHVASIIKSTVRKNV